MGGSDFIQIVSGKNASEAFKKAQVEAEQDFIQRKEMTLATPLGNGI
jgi:hypothetical protein